MSDTIVRIEKAENGYSVEICDEKVMESNKKSKSVYADPWKEYLFKDAAGVVKFVGEHLDKLKPPPDADEEYGTAFAQAADKED